VQFAGPGAAPSAAAPAAGAGAGALAVTGGELTDELALALFLLMAGFALVRRTRRWGAA
jgi:hypothetical protein